MGSLIPHTKAVANGRYLAGLLTWNGLVKSKGLATPRFFFLFLFETVVTPVNKGRFTQQKNFGTARIKLVRVPQKNTDHGLFARPFFLPC